MIRVQVDSPTQFRPVETAIPQDASIEMCVLGAIMIEPDAYPIAAGLLTPRDFYLDGHALLFEVMGEMRAAGIPPESIGVLSELRSRSLLDKAGGSGVVMGMLNSVPTAANIEAHARIVLEYSRRRALLRACKAAERDLYAGDSGADDVSAALRLALDRIAERGTQGDEIEPLREAAVAYGQRQAQRIMAQQGQPYGSVIAGTTTGFQWLDDASGGFVRGDLVILAARPNTSKTRCALYMLGCGARQSVRGGFISLDMTGDRLLAYAIPILANVNGEDVRADQVFRPFVPDDMALLRIRDVCAKADPDDMLRFVLQPRGKTIGAVDAYCRAMARWGASTIVIDQIQNISGWDRGSQDRSQFSSIVKGLKDAAARYNVCVVALHQIQREGADFPRLIHLKDTGNVEEYSDFVVLLHDHQRALLDRDGCYVLDKGRVRAKKGSDKEENMERQLTEVRPLWMSLAKSRAGAVEQRWVDYNFAKGVKA